MSTNFYVTNPDKPTDESLHVGLQAAEMFRFRAHPGKSLVTFDAWSAHLRQNAKDFRDEYGNPADVERFLAMRVLERDDLKANQGKREYHNAPQLVAGQPHISGKRYRDAQGFLFHDFEFS
jgi:hypothetical protein